MKTFKKYFLIQLFLMFIFCSLLYAQKQKAGEIINVNYDYKIAFCDLNSDDLSTGDVVEIYDGEIFITYLEVLEVSSAISKLVPVTNESKYKTTGSFSNIKIGYTAIKLDASIKEIQTVKEENIVNTDVNQTLSGVKTEILMPKNQSELEEKVKELTANYAELSNEFSKVSQEKKILAENNQRLSTDIENIKKEVESLGYKNSLLEQEILQNELNVKQGSCQSEIRDLKLTVKNLRQKLENMTKIIEGDKK